MPTDFEIAFANARKQGLSQFNFNGQQYTTQQKEEPSALLQLALTDKIKQEREKDPSLKYVLDFNTGLTKPELKDYWNWAVERAKNKGLKGTHDDVLYEMGNYDLQGYYKAAKEIDAKRAKGLPLEDWENDVSLDTKGHLIDRWKKPNHITFSDESKYHNGKDFSGGQWLENGNKWKFKVSPQTVQMYGKDYLQKYFSENENDVDLIY